MPISSAPERPAGGHRRPRPGRHRAEPASAANGKRRWPMVEAFATVLLLVGVGAAVAAESTADGGAATAAIGSAGAPSSVPARALEPATAGGASPRQGESTTSRLLAERRAVLTRVSRAGVRTEPRRRSGSSPGRQRVDGLQRRAAQVARDRDAALGQLAERASDRADELAAERWVLPLARYDISAGFGDGGSLWSSGSHTGLDFSATEGAPISAVTGGVVTTAGYSAKAGWAGNLVVVTVENGARIWYAHQSSVAVEVGDTVDPGQVVGYVGSTGNSTGPHLHLEVQVGRSPIDPMRVLHRNGLTP